MTGQFLKTASLLLSILPPLVALSQEESPNLVFNGSFERVNERGLPEGWSNWLKKLPEPNCITVDDSVAHSGERSLKISHRKPTSYSMMTRRVEFEPHRHYVITGWIKGENIKPGDGAMLARLYIGKEGGSTFKCSRTFSGAFDWRFIEIGPFDVGDRTWVSMIPYLHHSTGTVWYDDITMRLVTQADLDRRAQKRARDRLLNDLARVYLVAQESDDAEVLAQEKTLRERVQKTDDLPTSFKTRNGPPYFPLHTEVYKLMAQANRTLWKDMKAVPAVVARWTEPFAEAEPLDVARPGSVDVPWTIEMLKGELDQACVRLTNVTEEEQTLSLRLTDLKTKEGVALEAERITWRELRYVETRDGRVIDDPMPRIATGCGPVEVMLAPGITRDIWVMVDSEGVEAGQYKGSLEVCTGQDTQSLSIETIVHPLHFPEQVPIHTFAYAYTTWGLLSGRTEMSRADLRAHRVNTYVIHGGFTPWPTFDDKGQWQGLDWSKMDQQISLHAGAKCLLLWPGLEIGDRLKKLAPDGGPEYPSDLWKEFASRWAKELAAGMSERGFGYGQWALYLVDEPSGRRAEIARTVGEAVHAADPKVRIFENPYGAATDRDMRHMAPVTDIWCPALNTTKDQRLEFCRETAQEVWTYQVLGKTSDPLRAYRAAFWECFAKDLRGHGFWDYADCGGSAWDAFDNDRHDYAVVYDGAEDELIPSKRWEAYREGAEDFALLSMLRDRGAGQTAQSLAAAVVADPRPSTVRAARQQAIRALTAQH